MQPHPAYLTFSSRLMPLSNRREPLLFDLARLVTAIVRGDRFCEGNVAGAIERGFVTAICRRAAALLARGASAGHEA